MKKYNVAGHVFAVEGGDRKLTMDQYLPFETSSGNPLFTLHVGNDCEDALVERFCEETRQDDGDQTIISGTLVDGRKAFVYEWKRGKALLACSADYTRATLYSDEGYLLHAVDNSLMLIFALATANCATLLFHASTVVWQDKAFMFLGVSGTGKSTHSRLWLENIGGARLLNDDNPVVRIIPDGKVMVCGSPWSGKTPCYLNEKYELGGVVKLRQAPQNTIRRQNVIEAYAAIIGSVSGKRWEKNIADGIHSTTTTMIEKCGVWLLDCLPNGDAALLCNKTIAI